MQRCKFLGSSSGDGQTSFTSHSPTHFSEPEYVDPTVEKVAKRGRPPDDLVAKPVTRLSENISGEVLWECIEREHD